VDHLETVAPTTGNRTPASASGQAIIDIGFYLNSTTALPSSLTGLAFIARNATSNGTTTSSNAKTVAHELAHVVFSNDPRLPRGGGDDDADGISNEVNILRGVAKDNLSLTKSYLDPTQSNICSSKTLFLRAGKQT